MTQGTKFRVALKNGSGEPFGEIFVTAVERESVKEIPPLLGDSAKLVC